MRKYPSMSQENDEIREWLRREFERSGKKKGDLAAAWRTEKAAVSRVLNGTREMSASEHKIAVAFFANDIEGADSPDVSTPELNVRGGAGAGGIAVDAYTPDDEGGHQNTDAVVRRWGIPYRFVRDELRATPNAVNIIEVLGDSMEPTLKPGDRVLIDTNHKMPSPPGVYAVWDGFGIVIKRVEPVRSDHRPMVRLISDNPNHRPYEVSLEEANIIGRAICKISAM